MSALTGKVGCLLSIIHTISAPLWKGISTTESSATWQFQKNSGTGLRQRRWDAVKAAIEAAPIDITLGGWGQDGHVAYNQAKRHPLHHCNIEEIANSTIRIQENNIDTILSLAQRSFGAAYQFVTANVDHTWTPRVSFREESSPVQ